MGQPKPPCQNPKERLHNTREVSLGFTKKISGDEARRCPQCAQPVCLSGCPLGIDIPGFIRFLREGDAVSALERIKKDNPFPSICGRICPAPCESACIFYEEGSPIAIRALERYASDFGSKSNPRIKTVLPSNGKKVAIAGSGPFAMSAASFLLKDGFKVVMFEAASEPGGILRYGVPEFRLPQEVLKSEFEELKSQGLELHTNIFVGRMKPLDELIKDYNAVLLATGAGLPDFATIEGENLGGVYYAEEFLMRLQMLSKENIFNPAQSLLKGSMTVVVGSGYAALDAGRAAIRLGQETSLIFGGFEEEMEVPADEIKEAVDEGLKILTPFEPLKIQGDDQGFAQGVECRRLEIMEGKDGLSLEASNEITFLKAQTVILANSQRPNLFLSKVTPHLKVKADGTLWTDETRHQTSLDKVFALGGAVTGAATVVRALADGKKIAQSIKEFLQ